MPIYEYKCPKCDHPFERRVRFADSDLPQACPACGHERASKQISLVAHHTAGSTGASLGAGAACGPVG